MNCKTKTVRQQPQGWNMKLEMSDQIRLMAIHAHPDDESSKGAATIARYHHEGAHTILVCCTGGEEGDVLNPKAHDLVADKDIAAVRREELTNAAKIIGYDDLISLGYRDSGMPGSDANNHPDAFSHVPLEEAVEKLVAVIRKSRPHVIITYADERDRYPHPDHIRVHEASVAAFNDAGNSEKYPDAGEPWQPSKLYYVFFSGQRILELHEKFIEFDKESPFGEEWIKRASSWVENDHIIRVDVTGYTHIRREALLAHTTQIDPESPFWFGLPDHVIDSIAPMDDYLLAKIADENGNIVDVEGLYNSNDPDDKAKASAILDAVQGDLIPSSLL